MPHLLHVWPQVAKRLLAARRTLLMFDFDGTLSPIAPRPELAQLPEESRRLLARLSQQPRFVVGVISGRSLADVFRKVGLPGLIYAGNHGLEIEGPQMSFVHPEAEALQTIHDQAYGKLQGALAAIPGIVIEHKGLSLSVHYRLTPPEQAPLVVKTFLDTTAPFVETGHVRLSGGKQVLEVRPNVAWDKAKAIARLQELNPDATLTMFFGDDLTDEDGFAVVQAGGGIAVYVGAARGPTQALHRVDSPEEVTETLRRLAALGDS